jgi:hypothetical protein
MKHLITSILLLFLTNSVFSQQRKLEQVDDNLYHYTISEGGKISQSGYYKLINGEYQEHGNWKDHKFKTVAYFENGKMLWIKPNGKEKYTYKDMELHRLRYKVSKLEELVTLRKRP